MGVAKDIVYLAIANRIELSLKSVTWQARGSYRFRGGVIFGQEKMCESVFKVLIIGDPQVGKTSMVARYCYRDWMPNYKATVGGEAVV